MKNIHGSVFDMSFGFLSLVTSIPSALDLYLKLKGHDDLVIAFITNRNNIQKSISLASIILGIIACSSSKSLALQYPIWSPIFPSLEGLITRTNFHSLLDSENDLELIGHVLVIYLFLYRAFPEKTEELFPLSLKPIFSFIKHRGGMNEGMVDLWCLTLSGMFCLFLLLFLALHTCIINQKIAEKDLMEYRSCLENVAEKFIDSEEEKDLVDQLLFVLS